MPLQIQKRTKGTGGGAHHGGLYAAATEGQVGREQQADDRGGQ
jgi:hypothetical protein